MRINLLLLLDISYEILSIDLAEKRKKFGKVSFPLEEAE
jgi:hypothetical protein